MQYSEILKGKEIACDASETVDGKISNANICEELLSEGDSPEYIAASKQRAIDSGLYTPEMIEYTWG
jgi:hypothetical protein